MKLYDGIFPSRESFIGFVYELVLVAAWFALLLSFGHWAALAGLVAVCWSAPFLFNSLLVERKIALRNPFTTPLVLVLDVMALLFVVILGYEAPVSTAIAILSLFMPRFLLRPVTSEST
jgi:hypothetical protein